MSESNQSSEAKDFVIDDQDRYSRLRLIGWWDQDRIAAAKILVVGAGALGNEVLKNLALLGLGQIYLIDFDKVDETNLTRSILFRSGDAGRSKAMCAKTMIEEINPDTRVHPIDGNVLTEIGLGLVRDCDVVIGCLDNREARLWVNRMCWKVDTPWIDGGIQEINGVAKVFRPPNGACYECAMTEMDYKLISLRYSCPLLKQEDIQQGKVPTAPTIASIVGGLQVQEALKLLHELPGADGSALVFNGAANRFYETKYPVKEDCLSHETYDDPVALGLGVDNTIAELFEALSRNNSAQPTRLVLDRDFLVSLECKTCERTVSVEMPRMLVTADKGMCESCQMPMQSETIHEVAPDSKWVSKTFRQMGVPAYDIVKVEFEDSVEFVLLDADRAEFA